MAQWGKTDEVSSRPNWIDLDNYPAGTKLLFVDEDEARIPENKARGLTGAGWWLYHSYTDASGMERHKAEYLVAVTETALAAGDDDGEDSIVADYQITITQDSLSISAVEDGSVTFGVVATNSFGNPMTYQWQMSTNGGTTWLTMEGQTDADITLTGIELLHNGWQYRVIVADGDREATSDAFTLTVTGA